MAGSTYEYPVGVQSTTVKAPLKVESPAKANGKAAVTGNVSTLPDISTEEVKPDKAPAKSAKDANRASNEATKTDMKNFAYDSEKFIQSGMTLKEAQPKTGSFTDPNEVSDGNQEPTYFLDQYTIPKAGRATIKMSLKNKKSKYEDKYYSKFLLEGVAFSSNERVQMTETFENYVVSFKGTEPTTLQLKGTLLNSFNEDWLRDFMRFYEAYKASSIALRDDVQYRLVTIIFENFQFSGYLFGLSISIDGAVEMGVPFQLSMLVAKTDIETAVTFTSETSSYITITDKAWRYMQDMDRKCGTNLEYETAKNNVVQVLPSVGISH